MKTLKLPKQSPRRPTQKELLDLRIYVADCIDFPAGKEEIGMANEVIQTACISVFDHYTSSDYSGKLLMVVWNVSVGSYEVFGWRDGELTRVMQALDFAGQTNICCEVM